MAQPKNTQRQFADQQDALTAYLNDLLTVSEGGETIDEDNSFQQSESEVVSALNTDNEVETGCDVEKEPKSNAEEITNDTGADDPVVTDGVALPQAESPSLESRYSGEQSLTSLVKPLELASGFEQKIEQQGTTGINPVLLPQSFLESGVSVSESPKPYDALVNDAEALDQSQSEDEAVIIPDWAKTRFQCLAFSVGGYCIAAPLEKLNGIIEWPEHITTLPGRAQWFLGLYRARGQNVQVIDLETILAGAQVLASHARTQDMSAARQPARYILLVDDGRMGFASDTVANMLTLEPTQVKWNSNTQRQVIDQKTFVIGTVIEKMCSLLDIDTLVEEINQR